MSIINDGEIFAGIHKFKMFREEGNLFIDVYEALIGKSAYKFIAVPNLIIQEADKKYFGFGDSKAEALRDCLKKIKDVPIHVIVPSDNEPKNGGNWVDPAGSSGKFKNPSKKGSKNRGIHISRPLGKIYGKVLAESPRPVGSMNDIISAKEEKPKGEPVRNAKVTAVCKGVGKKKTSTNDSGYYEFTGLEDGVWMLRIKARGFEMQEAVVEIIGGGEYEENFD